MILYAPIIEPSVPAFAGNMLKVNFQHNIAVGDNVVGIAVTIKDYNTNVKLLEANNSSIDYIAGNVEFDIDFSTLIAGNFYKIQIAYTEKSPDEKTIIPGPYSTVGITRWLGENDAIALKVAGLDDIPFEERIVNPNLIEYNGTYSYNKTGLSEPVYQYKFELLDEDNKLVETSDWLLPMRDSNNKPIMKYILQNNLEYFINYTLCFTVLTVNGYSRTKKYAIAKRGLYPSFFSGTLIVTQEPEAKENGYVHIYINGDLANGVFRLIRREEYSNIWYELTRFNMSTTDLPIQFSWKDYSVEHGKKYYYAIQQYGLDTSQRVTPSDPGVPYYSTIQEVAIDEVQFEHMYLGDDKYQLKLAFNPQVSSFKETVLESKTDVIGGKYPFFFRNGNVRYKEIPISGLLSYFLDSEGFFLNTLNAMPTSLGTGPSAARTETNAQNKSSAAGFIRTTNLTNHNFASERQFKLAVLNWLNNGKPKLFRSPAEGNYVLRLMNINMSPNQQLGRMLHTVSATGYEIMEATPERMLEQNILSFQKIDSKFTGTADDYGAEIAKGEYLFKTEINSPLEGLIQLCALRIEDEGGQGGTMYLDEKPIGIVPPFKEKIFTFEIFTKPESIRYDGQGTYQLYGYYKKE